MARMCDRCGKEEATAFISQDINNEHHEYHLCDACAKSVMPMNQIIAGLFSIHSDAVQPVSGGRACSFCGATERDIAKLGRAGCARCYTEFKELFDPYIARLHGNVVHAGLIPASAGEEVSRRRSLSELRAKLGRAIEMQEYEMAAEYRDQIRAMEAEGGGKEDAK